MMNLRKITGSISPLGGAVLLAACTGTIDGDLYGGPLHPPSGGEDGSFATSDDGGATGKSPDGGGAPGDETPKATPTLARLSVLQWSNTVKDLFAPLDLGNVADALTRDAVVRFDNEADSLFVGQSLHDTMRSEADRIAALVAGNAEAVERLIPTGAAADASGRAIAYIHTFGRRAFRRPITDDEARDYLDLFGEGPTLTTGMGAFEAGVRVTLEAFLQSPKFIYRTSFGGEAVAGRARLTDHEIAANLAYALTNHPPDSSLGDLADQGALSSGAAISREAAKLLPTDAGQRAIDRFYFQYFGLGQYDTLQKDAPGFTAETGPMLHEEARRLLNYLFAEGLGLGAIFTTPVGFVNAPIARLYDLPGAFDEQSWTKVSFDPEQRPGLLTRLGFVTYFAYQERKNSIKRGTIINKRLLCTELSPPPGLQIPQLPEPTPDQTNREVVTNVTGVCGSGCHTPFINPAGFAFENFDGLGKFQLTENGNPIDASGTYSFASGAKSFANVAEFNQELAESEQAHACYAERWAANLYARIPREDDRALIARVAQRSVDEHLSSRELVLALIADEAFVTRVEAQP